MRCEVVAIGTELLLGQIVDTNSSWIGEHLAMSGIDSVFQVKVGDNFERMEFCIRTALERSDAVICCGGLGPTQDDITRNVIAKIMDKPLILDQEIADKIRHMFESRGRRMSENNLRQAEIPEGAAPIPEMPGTAPGLVCPIGEKVIFAVPGVPSEMRTMMEGTVLPELLRRSGQTSVIRSRTLRTWGNSESGLAELLADRIDELDHIGNPTIAFLASGIEGIKVRVTAKSDDELTASRILDAEEVLLRGIIGDAVFGIDDETMESVVLDKLSDKGLTLAVTESITGGILSSRLSDIDQRLNVFRGGIIEPAATGLKTSDNLAADAAKKAQTTFGADVGISAVVADPAEGHPRGTMCMHLAIGEQQYAQTVALPGDRARQRNYTVINLLNFLRHTLDGK